MLDLNKVHFKGSKCSRKSKYPLTVSIIESEITCKLCALNFKKVMTAKEYEEIPGTYQYNLKYGRKDD